MLHIYCVYSCYLIHLLYDLSICDNLAMLCGIPAFGRQYWLNYLLKLNNVSNNPFWYRTSKLYSFHRHFSFIAATCDFSFRYIIVLQNTRFHFYFCKDKKTVTYLRERIVYLFIFSWNCMEYKATVYFLLNPFWRRWHISDKLGGNFKPRKAPKLR